MGARVLVIAPGGRDARVITSILADSSIVATSGTGIDLLKAIRGDDYGATIIVDEALPVLDLAEVGRALAAQPPWADYPLILLTQHNSIPRGVAVASTLLGNVTLIERPLHPQTLTIAVKAALRARDRQRHAATYLAEREVAEEQVRILAATLEARVVKRTAELNRVSVEREAALERVKESEELYRYTVELNAVIPWTADPAGQMLSTGERWHAMTGLPAEQTRGDGWADALHPEDAQAILPLWHGLASEGKDLDVICRLRQSNDEFRWHRARAAPRLGTDGQVLRYYGTIIDVDDRMRDLERLHQVQAELIHVSRLSAMGAMASTLAHELNQPLTAIANYVRGCLRLIAGVKGDTVPMIVEALNDTDQSALRAGEIIRRLREMVTQGNIERIPENLSKLIGEACKIALVDATVFGIDYRIDLAPETEIVLVDRIQIQQVLINLLRNAVEALQAMSHREIVIATYVVSDSFCEVVVRDTGPGLANEVKDKLFSTFNTTKADGMGIGLSISRTIIESHGGDIWAESVAGGGTAFHFTLPRAAVDPHAAHGLHPTLS